MAGMVTSGCTFRNVLECRFNRVQGVTKSQTCYLFGGIAMDDTAEVEISNPPYGQIILKCFY